MSVLIKFFKYIYIMTIKPPDGNKDLHPSFQTKEDKPLEGVPKKTQDLALPAIPTLTSTSTPKFPRRSSRRKPI